MSLAKHILLYLALAFSFAGRAEVIDPNVPIISYVNFPSLDATRPLIVSGQLRVPNLTTPEKLPAVVIVHGSAGVDSRGSFYAQALNEAGIATLEIDMWAPRGWFGGVSGRPRGVPETLPDAYGALKFLASVPRINAEKIGIMGFSWGGVVTMLTATQAYTNLYMGSTLKFAAHLAHYPVCWVYNRVPGYGFNSFTGFPVLIQAGELDTYDDPDTCPKLVDTLPAAAHAYISVNMYKNATHAWDRLQPAGTVFDPYAYKGAGGFVELVPNPGAAFQARKTAVRFFERAFNIDFEHRGDEHRRGE